MFSTLCARFGGSDRVRRMKASSCISYRVMRPICSVLARRTRSSSGGTGAYPCRYARTSELT